MRMSRRAAVLQHKQAATAYGVEWDAANPSTVLTRLGAAAGFGNPVPAVGTDEGSSPFDDLMPWAGMRICNLVNGAVTAYKGEPGFSYTTAQVMVEIPRFWMRFEETGNKRRYWISPQSASGFSVFPAFQRAGKSYDKIYVGRYLSNTSAFRSISGVSLGGYVTRDWFRVRARQYNTGGITGYALTDLAARVAVQMLYLVEYANWNSQGTIGMGVVTGSPRTVGGTDSMTYDTGRAAGTENEVSVQYRGMEDLWGQYEEYVDGAIFGPGSLSYCLDPVKFSDVITADYIPLSYALSTSSGYIKSTGFDTGAPWLQLKTGSEVGSESTYIPDRAGGAGSSWPAAAVGGSIASGAQAGLFAINGVEADSVSRSFAARLMFLPPIT